MRAYKKIWYVKLIKKIANYLNNYEISEGENKINILAECQEIAISIGNRIEEQDSSLLSTVELLEDFCELLYQMSLNSEENPLMPQLFEKLTRIRESIDSSETEIEVLFLPYKASMWDSFDSIYKEACLDQQCSVKVVPLPYYNLDDNGKVIGTDYEGNKLPEGVEVVDYRAYSLEERRPDVIFIHNPYDEHNAVTSIDPQYYSSELIKYTEHLVYIPYYVSLKDNIGDEYCKHPGVLNAWKVFVQSEIMAEKYKKFNPEEKIIAMGSPKFDMALQREKKGKASFPSEWNPKLEGKTVFLLNTHLYSILNETENFIKNLQFIFKIFLNNHKIALIWRPHPLSLETMRSFNKNIMMEYLEIINDFKALPNVVYDETGNLYDAVNAADAYIGDQTSSLILLFGATGKPMLFMNQNSQYQYHYLHGVRSLCAGIWKDEVWMFSWEFNGLFRIDLKTNEIVFETIIDKENSNDSAMYSNMIIRDEKMFLIPVHSSYIAVYDRNKIRYLKMERKEFSQLYDTVLINDNLWIFSRHYSIVLYCIDMKSEHIRTIEVEAMKYLNNFKSLGNATIFSGAVMVGKCVYRACSVGKYVFYYHLDTGLLSFADIQCSNKAFKGICYDGKDFWLLPMGKDNVVRWNKESGEVEEFHGYPLELDTDVDELFCAIAHYQDSIWLIPQKTNKIIRIRLTDRKKMECIDYMTDEFSKDFPKANVFRNYQFRDSTLFLFPFESNQIIQIDIRSNSIKGIKTPMPDIYGKSRWIEMIAHGCEGEDNRLSHIYKDSFCSLEDFLSIVCDHADQWQEKRKYNFLKDIANNDGTAGSKIWDYVKRELTNG